MCMRALDRKPRCHSCALFELLWRFIVRSGSRSRPSSLLQPKPPPPVCGEKLQHTCSCFVSLPANLTAQRPQCHPSCLFSDWAEARQIHFNYHVIKAVTGGSASTRCRYPYCSARSILVLISEQWCLRWYHVMVSCLVVKEHPLKAQSFRGMNEAAFILDILEPARRSTGKLWSPYWNKREHFWSLLLTFSQTQKF